MPRPKRTIVASAVAAPTRVAKPLKSTTTAQPPRKPSKPSQVIDSFSDDSDGLVVKSTRPRTRKPWQPDPQKDVDVTMAGALPAEGEEEEDTSPVTAKTRSPCVAISSSRRATPASNAFKNTRGRSSSTKKSARGSPGSRLANVADAHNGPSQEESSLMDPSLLTFGSLDSESPAQGTRPPSAMKVGGTPAHEVSILALTNFKRRARQPSLLRMVHQTTDVEDNDLDDLDDFHPDAESTPLQARKSGTTDATNEPSGVSLSNSDSRGKKRKLSSPVVQVPRSSPPYDPPSGADVAESQRSSSPSLPAATVVSDEEIVETQEPIDSNLMSETMAPPMSSSPLGDNINDSPSPIKPRQRRRGRPREMDHASASENEETGRPVKTRAKQKTKAQTISTAKLQALLPRRRTRVPQERDEYDIHTSDDVEVIHDDSDLDELQLPPPRPAVARKTATSKPKKSSKAGKRAYTASSKAKGNTRTYGRRSSDKENESAFSANADSVDVDEPTEISVDLPKGNLVAIAKKFEDVDAFEMEFENVDVEGGTSSPWR